MQMKNVVFTGSAKGGGYAASITMDADTLAFWRAQYGLTPGDISYDDVLCRRHEEYQRHIEKFGIKAANRRLGLFFSGMRD
jgi:hypothetical protein